MKRLIFSMLALSGVMAASPVLAQTATPTRAVPQCKQFPGSDLTVPCTGVVPIDGATGNPINWRELFSSITLDGNVNVPDTSVNAGAVSAKAQPVQNADGSKVATDATLTNAVTQLTNVVAKLTTLITNLGSPAQAGAPVALAAGTQSIGSVSNTGFNVTGTLPAFAATPTFNVGTVPVLTSNIQGVVATNAPSYTNGSAAALSLTSTGALRVNLENGGTGGGTISGPITANIGTTNGLALDATTNSLFKAGQSIGNTTFGATQSGTWNVGVTGPVAVTGNFYQATQPVSGTVVANLGTVGGLATETNLTSVKTALGTPFQAGGSIANTAFGISGTLPAFAATPTVNLGTIAGAATDAKVEAVRALLAGTVKVDNGVALDGQKNATVNLSTFDRLTLGNIMRGTMTIASFAPMTVGTAYGAGNGIGIACTAEGNVVLQGIDGSQITVPVSLGYNQFAFAITKVVSQTATCTFTSLS